jgi:hypothetical protein
MNFIACATFLSPREFSRLLFSPFLLTVICAIVSLSWAHHRGVVKVFANARVVSRACTASPKRAISLAFLSLRAFRSSFIYIDCRHATAAFGSLYQVSSSSPLYASPVQIPVMTRDSRHAIDHADRLGDPREGETRAGASVTMPPSRQRDSTCSRFRRLAGSRIYSVTVVALCDFTPSRVLASGRALTARGDAERRGADFPPADVYSTRAPAV